MKKILITTIIAVGAQNFVEAQNLVPQQAQTIIYVKSNGTGDGSSWANACDLDNAMSKSGTQIWVQKGTYYPTGMLSVPNSMKMYGGFEGTESNLSQRDSLSDSTIIDAQKKFGSVIRLGVSAELNGFVIQNGNAQNNPHSSGGGVFADDNSVIANCLIINNSASTHGGGIYSKGPVTIIGSTIRDNTSIGSGANIFGNCLTVFGHSEGSSIQSETPAECTAPVISSHPATTAQSTEQNVVFSAISVSAIGTATLSYQWYSNTVNNNTEGTPIEGATDASYTPLSTTVGTLYYYCTITNACGSEVSNVSGAHTVAKPIIATGCASDTFNFGMVSFASATERTISGNDITQVWSDAVTATGCQKTAFNGGSSSAYKIDCRSNPSYPGDLFSWCAVAKYASTLCPSPWRVPTTQDFVNLDKAMGGTGNNRIGVTSELPKYFGTGSNQWGAVYGGHANAGTLSTQGLRAWYWSQTEYSSDYVCHPTLDSGLIYPQNHSAKYFGFSLRCVR